MSGVDKDIIRQVTNLHQAGADLELILLFMRKKGLYQIDSIRVLQRVMGLSVPEAKDAVDGSRTWSDQYENVQRVRLAAMQAVIELSKENDDTLPRIIIETDQD